MLHNIIMKQKINKKIAPTEKDENNYRMQLKFKDKSKALKRK